ncbi:MAG TPA: malto-oligosyltrehalose synthase, partial [Thermoanaerobaculia bacterium]
ENGPASTLADFFDIDWEPPSEHLANRVLLPILGDHYGRVLEAGELRLVRVNGGFEIRYHEHRLPVSPRSLDRLLAAAARACRSAELAFLAAACAGLPHAAATDRQSALRRHRDKRVIAERLGRLCAESAAVAAAVDGVVARINARPDRLHALLERQNYRPAYWRTAADELDYRHFFDVHSLVALHIEDPRVFADTHALVLSWVASGLVDGLRVDHPDGLADPAQYFARLRRRAPEAWIVAEKVLLPGERLPAWPIAGTTGYDFLFRADGVLVDPAGEEALSAIYARETGESIERVDWPDLAHAGKLQAMTDLLAADVERLAELWKAVCERHRRQRDYTRRELRQALREVAACFPVYRSYVRAMADQVSGDDREAIARAVAAARARRPDLSAELFDFFVQLMARSVTGELETELVLRFQQLTGPVMAKGVEDTAFYRFHRLASRNEVGGDPACFAISVEDFHRASEQAQRLWPDAMLTTSTHDTKRSEDVRARLHLLAEIPERWGGAVRHWAALAERHRSPAPDGGSWPDRNLLYLLFQTLVGAWPLDLPRAL